MDSSVINDNNSENINFNEFVESEDALFHFTKLNIFLEKIMPSSKLLLSLITSGSDPYESSGIYPNIGAIWGDDKEFIQANKKYPEFLEYI